MTLRSMQQGLSHLRKHGYECAVVEKWIPQKQIRIDAYNFIDCLALKKDCPLIGAQFCTLNDFAAHRRKILGNRYAKIWSGNGMQILLIGFGRKKKGEEIAVREQYFDYFDFI